MGETLESSKGYCQSTHCYELGTTLRIRGEDVGKYCMYCADRIIQEDKEKGPERALMRLAETFSVTKTEDMSFEDVTDAILEAINKKPSKKRRPSRLYSSFRNTCWLGHRWSEEKLFVEGGPLTHPTQRRFVVQRCGCCGVIRFWRPGK